MSRAELKVIKAKYDATLYSGRQAYSYQLVGDIEDYKLSEVIAKIEEHSGRRVVVMNSQWPRPDGVFRALVQFEQVDNATPK